MATDTNAPVTSESLGEINKYDFKTETSAVFKAENGLNVDVVRQISEIKDEPQWMLDFRLKSLQIVESTPNATLLVKVACEGAVGKRSEVSIFGTDYLTPDGTALRDYITSKTWRRRISMR